MTSRAPTAPDVALAAPHPAALDAARELLQQGGNVVDAAVAAAASLTVAYPHMCSLGGDAIALLREPDGTVVTVNGSGAHGSGAAGLEGLEAMPLEGPATVTVPGAVSAWQAILRRAGRTSVEEVLAPAVRQAQEGVAVSRGLARALSHHRARLFGDPGMRRLFFSEDQPLSRAAILVQPELAGTLKALSERGLRDFYDGQVGDALLRGFRRLGVPVLGPDLRRHAAEVGPPLTATFGDLRVSTAGPSSQGYLLVEILEILHGEYAGGWDQVDPAFLAEVMWGADARRNDVLADPSAMKVSVEELLSTKALGQQAAAARARLSGEPERAGRQQRPRPDGDTVAITAVDDDGRAVSLIQSVFHAFGSGLLEEETGIVLHNRGAFFSLDESSPNRVRPRKRPAHTLMPVIVERPGTAEVYAHGTMGGQAQPQIHAQLMLRRFEGLTGQAIVAAPRFVVGGLDAGSDRDWILAEPALGPRDLDRLRSSQLDVQVAEADDGRVGHAMVAGFSPGTGFEAGADPRSDGGVLTS